MQATNCLSTKQIGGKKEMGVCVCLCVCGGGGEARKKCIYPGSAAVSTKSESWGDFLRISLSFVRAAESKKQDHFRVLRFDKSRCVTATDD